MNPLVDRCFYKLHVKEGNHALPLVIAFNGLRIDPHFNFEGTLEQLQVHALFLCDREYSWYLMPLEDTEFQDVRRSNTNLSCSEAAVTANVHTIQRLIAGINYTHIATVGVSMGGFAALLYGALFGASHVIAFDTQTFIDKHTRAQMMVTHWASEIYLFHERYHAFAGPDTKYQNLANILPFMELKSLPKMLLVTGLKINRHNWIPHRATHNHTIDELHVYHLAHSLLRQVGVRQYETKMSILWVPNAGHNSANMLRAGRGCAGVSYYYVILKGLGLA